MMYSKIFVFVNIRLFKHSSSRCKDMKIQLNCVAKVFYVWKLLL